MFLATAGLDWKVWNPMPHAFEHGTLPFLDIIGIQHGEWGRGWDIGANDLYILVHYLSRRSSGLTKFFTVIPSGGSGCGLAVPALSSACCRPARD